MADTASAAFFAKKKKKKKTFKGFNANKIDVESVTQTVHVYGLLCSCGCCCCVCLFDK
jgi:hypothetical protein